MEELVDFLLRLGNFVEVLVSNILTTLFECQDEITVFKTENDISDCTVCASSRLNLCQCRRLAEACTFVFGLLLLLLILFLLLLTRSFVTIIVELLNASGILVHVFADLFDDVLLESECGGLVRVVSEDLLIEILLPLIVVFLFQIKLDGVITSSYCCHIPVNLLHFASLIKITDRDSENECNGNGGCANEAHLIVLHLLVGKALHTAILNEKTASGDHALRFIRW